MMPGFEICHVCGDVITIYDQVAIVDFDKSKAGAERRAHATCCPVLHVKESDLLEDTWQNYARDTPMPPENERVLLKLSNVDVFIRQAERHHIDIILNNEEEVIKHQPQDTPIDIGLTYAIDRRGNRATISLTGGFEKYLKEKGLFAREKNV